MDTKPLKGSMNSISSDGVARALEGFGTLYIQPTEPQDWGGSDWWYEIKDTSGGEE